MIAATAHTNCECRIPTRPFCHLSAPFYLGECSAMVMFSLCGVLLLKMSPANGAVPIFLSVISLMSLLLHLCLCYSIYVSATLPITLLVHQLRGLNHSHSHSLSHSLLSMLSCMSLRS